MHIKYLELKKNLNARNVDFKFCRDRDEIFNELEILTSECKTVGIGNSQTLKSLEISKHFINKGKDVYDKTYASDLDDSKRIKKLSLTSDCYITSTNAIALSGEIVNIDHSGNRVAAMIYGPEKVIIIATTNKVVENEQSAVKRALMIATPQNARRAKITSPCSVGKPCTNCSSDVRVCNYLSIIRGQNEKCRMTVLLLDEELGF